MNSETDCIVIGGGPGGYSLGIRLGQLGLRAVVVEREHVGGVCLNWGCIPSKALITTASRYDDALHGSALGVSAEGVRLDLPQAMKRSRQIVHHHTSGVASLLAANGTKLVLGSGRLLGARAVEVRTPSGSIERFEARRGIVVATGARPRDLPGFPLQAPLVTTAEQAVFFDELPEHLIVLGGGVIGLELGSAYQTLGSRLTVVELGPELLPGLDRDLVRVVEKHLVERGAEIHLGTRAVSREILGPKEVRVGLEKEGQRFDRTGSSVLVAAGFVPNSEDLGLDELRIRRDARGHIQVDAGLETNVPGIFAIGDVTGPPYLAHKAFKEAEIVAERLAGKSSVRDYVALPAAIFTEPEIATVGLSEAAARQKYGDVEIGKFPLSALGRAMALGKTDGFVKLVAHQGRLVGAGVVGAEASELISELSLALEVGATLADLALTIHSHPTLAEAVGEAAAQGLGQAVHILNRKRPKAPSAA